MQKPIWEEHAVNISSEHSSKTHSGIGAQRYTQNSLKIKSVANCYTYLIEEIGIAV